MMTEKELLIDEIDAFLTRHKMKPSRFGREALNNPNFVGDMYTPTFSPKLSSVTRIRDWMAQKDRELTMSREGLL